MPIPIALLIELLGSLGLDAAEGEAVSALVSKIAQQCTRAVVREIIEHGTEQLLATQHSATEHRVNVPVHQPFGFNSHAPLDGAVTHVLQNGSDPADLVALMPSNPAAMRMGGLREGESILYDSAGQKLHFQNGRVVAMDATEGMVINQKGQPLLTLSEQGHVFYGDLYVKGHIYADEDVTGGGVSLGEHAHDGVEKGKEKTDKPGGGEKPPEPPKPPEPEPPEELPPWREAWNKFIGQKGGKGKGSIRIVSGGRAAREALFQRIVQWMRNQGINIAKREPLESTRNGEPIRTGEKIVFSDGTIVALRDISGSQTPDGWLTIEISNNFDVARTLIGKRGVLKIKFSN